MDGDVCTEIFEPGSDPAERDVTLRSPLDGQGGNSNELDSEVEERLEQIGYLE
jgi:hypothetical protein